MDHRDKINVEVLKNHVKSKCLKWKTMISIPTIPNHTQPFCGLYIHLLTQYRYHDSNTQPYPTDQPTHREWLSQLLSQGRTALIEIWICPGTTWNWYIFIYTHMHTHTHRYIYIYRERERSIAQDTPALCGIGGFSATKLVRFQGYFPPTKRRILQFEGVVLSEAPSAVEAKTRTAAFGTETKL